MAYIDEDWNDGEDKALDAKLLKYHQARCKKECDNFKLSKEVCEYYQAEYGYFSYCFLLEHGGFPKD